MIRRIVCIILTMMLLISLIPQSKVDAQAVEQDPASRAISQFLYHDPDMEDLFCSNNHIIYWNLVNSIAEDPVLSVSLSIASWIIKETPDEERCAEFLASLLLMQQSRIAQQIENQSEYDDLKGWKDYVEDAVSIASDYLGATGVLSTISPAVETLADGIDLVEGNISQAKYYKTIVADYCYSKEVLQAIIDHCENDCLRSAAAEISLGRDDLLLKQLDCLTNELGNIAKFESAFFLKQLSFPLMKETDCYKEGKCFQKFVDQGESIVEIYSSVNLAFKITMLAGDAFLGTTNTYRRYQEMRILSDIAASVSKEISQTNIPQNSTDAKTAQAVNKKCSLYKMLLTTHIRGEYLVYQLLTQDAGLKSQFHNRLDCLKSPEETTEGVYSRQIQAIQKYYDIVEGILLQLQSPSFEGQKDCITRIDKFSEGKLQEQYLLTYDEDQHLTKVELFYVGGGVTYYYRYDHEGRLVERGTEDFPCTTSYTYDEDGKLIQWTEAEGSEITFKCEYDTSSMLSTVVGTGEGAVYTRRFYYNENSQLTQVSELSESEGGNASWDYYYDYDFEGRLSSIVLNYNGNTTKTSYSYDYEPIIISQRTGAYSYNSMELWDPMGHELLSIYLGNASFTTDADGYLIHAISDDAQFNFYYIDDSGEEISTAVSQASDTQQAQNIDSSSILSWDALPNSFTFTSGSGGWSTGITLHEDGSFTGEFYDSDMGDNSDEYPKGTCYYCNFSGRFSDLEKVNNSIYSTHLVSISLVNEPGEESIENGIRYISANPYGLDNASQVYIYCPGTPLASIPEDCLSWVTRLYQLNDVLPPALYVIYNQGGQQAFVGEL